MKKLKKHINIIIIVMLIILATILIGTPLYESNTQIMFIIFGIYSICYFVSKIVKKEKIEINKIDIGIFAIVFSSLLALVFKTYITLDGTIDKILKSFCILSIYIIVKNECKKNPQYLDIIVNTIILSILALCIIGLDEISANYFEGFKKIIKYKYIEYDEVRIGSLFAYPNTMAAICGTGIFLCIGQAWKNKKIQLIVGYIIISLIMLITMFFTYSRLVYILFAITVVFYLLILCKKYNIDKRINKKSMLIIGFICIIFITYVLVGLNIYDKIKINTEYQKILYTAEANKQYNFKFYIENNAEEKFKIKITEKNKYFDDIQITEKEFEIKSGIKEITIQTKQNTEIIYINIEKEESKIPLIISKAYINEEELFLKYKFLPTKIIDKIESISLKNKSAWERFAFIKDGIVAIKDNWIIGQGGKAWETVQYKVQSYNYYTKEMHCLPIKIFLENGIVGFLGYILIVILILKLFIQEIKKEKIDMWIISIIVAILFLLCHNMLDFDVSFFYVLLIVSMLISILSSREIYEHKGNNNIIYIILIITSIFSLYTFGMKLHYKKNTENMKINSFWTEERILKTYNKLIPFDKNAKIKYYRKLENMKAIDYTQSKKVLEDIIKSEKYEDQNLNLDNIYSYIECEFSCNQDIDKCLNFCLQYIKNTEDFFKYQPGQQLERLKNIRKITNLLKQENISEYVELFQSQFISELAEKEKYILDYEKTRSNKEQIEEYKRIIKELNL